MGRWAQRLRNGHMTCFAAIGQEVFQRDAGTFSVPVIISFLSVK